MASFDSFVFKLEKKKAKCRDGARALLCSGYLHCHDQTQAVFSLLIPYGFYSWLAEAVTELLWPCNLWVGHMQNLRNCFSPMEISAGCSSLSCPCVGAGRETSESHFPPSSVGWDILSLPRSRAGMLQPHHCSAVPAFSWIRLNSGLPLH